MAHTKATIGLDELREDTFNAIARGKEMEAQKLVEDTAKEKERHAAALAWAELILRQVPACCKEAAAKGKSKAFVLANTPDGNINSGGVCDTTNGGGKDWAGWNTRGEGLKYYYLCDLLSEIDLEVDAEYEWDGGGMYSWISIYVSW